MQRVATPLDTVVFLARSTNRVAVLRLLAEEGWRRPALAEETGASRVTVGRIISDLESRGLVRRRDTVYEATALGEILVADFDELLDTVETIDKLRPVIDWLPTDEMGFDLRALSDADVTLPSAPDPSAPSRRASARIRDSTRVRVCMSVVIGEVLEAARDAVETDNGEFEGVFTDGVVETIAADEALSATAAEMVGSDRVSLYRWSGEFNYNIGLLDGIAAIGVTDDENLPRAYLESEDDAVREWVASEFDRLRNGADPLSPDAFDG